MQRQKNCFKISRLAVGTTEFPVESFSTVKRLRREAGHSFLSVPRLIVQGAVPTVHHVPSLLPLISKINSLIKQVPAFIFSIYASR
jgi:hypothetical protein